ncbi:MAG: hypothetical protein ABII64_08290 [Elusimicrobiota bacterium]
MKINWKKLDIKGVANIVAGHLSARDIDCTLVGGACVSIYSANKYVSLDVDFVTDAPLKQIDAALDEIGFRRKSTRHYIHSDCAYILDFIPPPLAIGGQPVRKTEIVRTGLGTLKLLTPTDCVKDRLAAFFHWNDYQSLEQAVLVAKKQENKIDLSEIENWAKQEKHIDKYDLFFKKLKVGN